ncbi:hypothetical protein K402DRAFT_376058 [Aulographum hederae CBS 113979]|uniref:Uncharacterized protein n=1 Tax=Aulographum hederae CBS 113979 TaxID=1176131 RepID=A0A6G1H2U8_9PEZI|nr:hypothetical protein K402DRAFT_376058 [Aulographum hederae CBS 113979]
MVANAVGFALDAASFLVPLALMDGGPKPPDLATTSIKMYMGHGAKDAAGKCPHIALWDNDGNRIGQSHPDKKCHIDEGNVYQVSIPHSQTSPPDSQADPYYVMLSQLDDDAICIASVAVNGIKIQGSFFGDTGYMCGQSWFPSDNAIGSDFSKPRCVWLDANHDNDINARAISFHLNDLNPDTEKMAQYRENQDTLCRSSPRFSFWGNLLPDGIPPFFLPKLEYIGDNGRDKDINRILDDPNNPVDKGVYLHQGEPKSHKRQTPRQFGRRAKGANHDPSHLIITDRPDAGAREVCEHPTSYGWDIANTHENLFCDMEHKQLYPLCDAAITQSCFDVEAKTLVPGMQKRDEHFEKLRFGRSYSTEATWTDKKA